MTQYNLVFDRFKDKITYYSLPLYEDELQKEILKSLMIVACSKFKRVCKINLSDRDDAVMVFNYDLDDEVIDIITELMVAEWLKPFLNNEDNLKNHLSTKDYKLFSPGDLLRSIQNAYNLSYQRARSAINEYSFVHGDFGSMRL